MEHDLAIVFLFAATVELGERAVVGRRAIDLVAASHEGPARAITARHAEVGHVADDAAVLGFRRPRRAPAAWISLSTDRLGCLEGGELAGIDPDRRLGSAAVDLVQYGRAVVRAAALVVELGEFGVVGAAIGSRRQVWRVVGIGRRRVGWSVLHDVRARRHVFGKVRCGCVLRGVVGHVVFHDVVRRIAGGVIGRRCVLGGIRWRDILRRVGAGADVVVFGIGGDVGPEVASRGISRDAVDRNRVVGVGGERRRLGVAAESQQ